MKRNSMLQPSQGREEDYLDDPDQSQKSYLETQAEVAPTAHSSVPVTIWAIPVVRNGETFYPAVTVQEPLECYLVPSTEFQPTKSTVELVDPKDKYEQAYDWSDELEAMVKDVETVRRNILVSFWRSGAFNRAEAKKPAVRSQLFNSAFPFKLEDSQ